MSLIETIQKLSTTRRTSDDDYEYSSDFLEWFYQNLYREQGFIPYPALRSISKEAEYECMKELCKMLINFNYAKTLDNETLINRHENMKKWLIDMAQKYEQSPPQ